MMQVGAHTETRTGKPEVLLLSGKGLNERPRSLDISEGQKFSYGLVNTTVTTVDLLLELKYIVGPGKYSFISSTLFRELLSKMPGIVAVRALF